MSERGLNSADTSRPSARRAVALGLVLLVVMTVAGAALGGVTAAESQSSPIEISNWTDLQAINDSQATLSDDYVLVNDLNKSTAGYNAVVLNQTATEFTEDVIFDEGESRVNLTRTPVAELLSNDEGLNLTVVDSANGTIERENTSSFSNGAVTYTTPTERFVGFSPIGPSFYDPFIGSFDAQGNTIRDLLIDRPTDDEVGLFGVSEGTIEQVTVANATITGSFAVGGLVGSNDGGTVSNSSASGNVTGFSQVGGLVGFNIEGPVSNSSASVNVTGSDYVGGLIGRNSGGTVSNSSASGAVSGTGEFGGVGGLVGSNGYIGMVSNSSASGNVTGSIQVGGLVGDNRVYPPDGLFGNSSWGVSNSSASGAVNGSEQVGGLVGFNDGIVSTSSASGNVTGSSRVGGLVGEHNEGTVSTSSASGAVDGSSRVGGLVGDNGGTVGNSSASGAVNGSDFVGGLVGFNFNSTVGNSSASGAVTGSDDVGGLIGEIGFEGTVSESLATGAVTGSSDVGGLVGQLGSMFLQPGEEAILRDSYYDTQTTEQQAAVGTIEEGLVGGTAELRGEVAGLPTSQMQGASASQNMGALDFTNTWRVVTNPPGYPELRSLSDGPDPSLTAGFTITPEDPIVGEQLTLDADPSTPESDIESYDWTLGDGTTATGKQVTHTYTNSGQFTVELTVQDGTETDTATETVSVSPPSSSVEISDWSDLDDIRNDTDADYVLVNDLNKSTAGYNAVVLNQTATEFTEDVSFDSGESRVNLTRTPVAEVLSNDDGLNLTVVDSANGTIERENTSSGSNVAVSYTTPTERFVGFSPIGPSIFESFRGSFDGQGNTIRDLIIDRPTDSDIGVFGVSEGTIKQVTVANATITGSDSVGGLVGDNDGTVSNSSASGTVNATGSADVGGLVGENRGTVSTSSASGNVTGSENVGGLVGYNLEAVSNSSASGAVNGSFIVGGLVGYNFNGTVSTSSASGAVTGSSNVGGFVGGNFEGNVSNSSASGAVTGSRRVGGLIGGKNEGTVSSSSASGNVTGSENVGGLVGWNFEGAVSNSSASGAVTGSFIVGGLAGGNDGTVSTSSASGNVTGTGSTSVGGLIGDNDGTVSNSSASGAVTGSDGVGGLVGDNSGTVSNSSASGTVNATGSDGVGGLVGRNFDENVSNSSASGAVTGSGSVGGLVGYNYRGTVSTSSASGNVTGSENVGGLVGFNSKGTVSESFATGAVTGSTSVGGLVGQLGRVFLNPGQEAILRDSYYDNQTTGQQDAVGTIEEGNGTAELRGEVAGLPTSQMQGASAAQNMSTLDFTSTWRVVTNPPGYPKLRGLPDVPDPGPPPLPDQESPPQDPDGDGRFEDVDGDGEFTIFDVQAFFVNFQSETVQSNPTPFKFDESGDGVVTIFDVQALFLELAG